MTTEQEKLRWALATMPEADRIVFELARFDGLTLVEIADALEMDIDEVERSLARAMLHLVQATTSE